MTAHQQRAIMIIVIMGFAILTFNQFGTPWPDKPKEINHTVLNKNIAAHPLLYFQTIDINTANLNDLTSIPKIGPVLGQRIIDYRNTNGPFLKLENLGRVQGIGAKTISHLRNFCHVRE